MPAVIVHCACCGKTLTTYLNVLADVYGKCSKVLINNRVAEGYEWSDTHEGQPDYYCVACWESAE